MKKRLWRTLTVLTLCLALCVNAAAMQIFVKTLTGKTITLEVEPTDPEPLPGGVTELTGGVYALSGDTDLTSTLKITGEVTLDLNGHVLSGDGMDSVILVDGGALTRAQAVTMLYRYMQHRGADVSVGEDTNILSYTDAFDVPEWAVPAVQCACGAGVMQGSGGYLTPNGGCTRAQIVTLLWRAANIG